MGSLRVVTFRMAPEKVAELDSLAQSTDRDCSYLLNEAVENYLSEQQRFMTMVEEGLETVRNGQIFSQEEVDRMVGEWEQAAR
jgi:predicted transcriptional regulator